MIWAIKNSLRTQARPHDRATCPCCKAEVIAKCGEIVSWHWAHRALDCDPWYEPESQWHLDWKNRFPALCQEVIIPPHRADIKTPQGVIEFQASPISSHDIIARETFYQNMVWILRGEDFMHNFSIRESSRAARKICPSCSTRFSHDDGVAVLYDSCPICGDTLKLNTNLSRPYWTFRWRHPRQSWFVAQKPVGIDHEGMIFWIKKIYTDSHCAGWGTYERKPDFIFRYSFPQTGFHPKTKPG